MVGLWIEVKSILIGAIFKLRHHRMFHVEHFSGAARFARIRSRSRFKCAR